MFFERVVFLVVVFEYLFVSLEFITGDKLTKHSNITTKLKLK
jgi:hypothetical protein